MIIKLDKVEVRVLGVLIEKSLSQSGSYPLTLNAVVLGANQKQNREPVLSLSETEVGRVLHSLERKKLVGYASVGAGARANRFEHHVAEQLKWDRREQAVMAELMLRDRQTIGELRTRASRMTPFPDLPAVAAVLDSLAAYDPPCVEELPREPGRSASRYRHLIGEDSTVGEPAAPAPSAAAIPAVSSGDESPTSLPAGIESAPSSATANDPAAAAGTATIASLTARVAELEERVTRLAEEVAELRRV